MKRTVLLCPAIMLLWITAAAAQTPPAWIEGKHYSLLRPAQPINVSAGKVEVIEVFSYGCPGCLEFYPYMNKLKASLPKQAEVSYVPASWKPDENWPTFQQAYLTAQVLGVAAKAHDAMFEAIWTSGELAVMDVRTGKLKKTLPSIEDIAKFYARVTGVKAQDFITTAKSFSINTKMNNADVVIKAYRAESTPTLIVQGKYRLTPTTAGGYEQTIQLVNWLVAKELKPSAVAPAAIPPTKPATAGKPAK